ncbi:hypothetical protein WA158_001194 [Blastocystis sp. Blastoise]
MVDVGYQELFYKTVENPAELFDQLVSSLLLYNFREEEKWDCHFYTYKRQMPEKNTITVLDTSNIVNEKAKQYLYLYNDMKSKKETYVSIDGCVNMVDSNFQDVMDNYIKFYTLFQHYQITGIILYNEDIRVRIGRVDLKTTAKMSNTILVNIEYCPSGSRTSAPIVKQIQQFFFRDFEKVHEEAYIPKERQAMNEKQLSLTRFTVVQVCFLYIILFTDISGKTIIS